MTEIRIAQYLELTTVTGITHRYQNYFVGQSATLLSASYAFAPFQADGALASLNGDNETLRILFPNIEVALRLVEQGDGNRLSELTLTTAWLNANDQILTTLPDYYIGIGASYSDTTIELRFRSAIDSVGSAFPARTLTRELVGPLPLNSELYLR
jgi:hypothetical protein